MRALVVFESMFGNTEKIAGAVAHGLQLEGIDAGLVEVRPDAQRRIYALRADGLVEIGEWINRYRRYWADHLDALERHLERKHKESR